VSYGQMKLIVCALENSIHDMSLRFFKRGV